MIRWCRILRYFYRLHYGTESLRRRLCILNLITYTETLSCLTIYLDVLRNISETDPVRYCDSSDLAH